MVKIHLLKAFEGDFIWISYGSTGNEHHILVDGGVEECGEKYAEIIEKIAEQTGTIEALILTHVDYDHIAGVCDGIARVKKEILQKLVKRILFNASALINQEIKVTPCSGEYSVADGLKFIDVLEQKGLKKCLCGEVLAGQSFTLEDNAVLKIISPGRKQLDRFYEKWEKYEKVHETTMYSADTKDIQENLTDLKKKPTRQDTSINNAASIAFLLEYENVCGAFLGDANASVCTAGLKKFGITSRYNIDILKISHHGSAGNTNLKLLKYLNTENYLLSTNGNSGRTPSKILIAKLIKSCEDNHRRKVNLYCNYEWWDLVYYDEYFTEDDIKKYIETETLMKYKLDGEGVTIKNGLLLYGKG